MQFIKNYIVQEILTGFRKPAYLAKTKGKSIIIKTPENWEILAASRMNHPNVVSLEGTVLEKNTQSEKLALKYIPGIDIHEYMSTNGPITDENYYRIALQIARGTAHIHQVGFIHNDLKPSNIILTPDAQPVITDLGSCTPIENKTRLTGTTPGYRSMEQLRRENMPESDTFSIGAVMYFMTYHSSPVFPNTTLNPTRLEEINRLTRKIPRKCHPEMQTSRLVRNMLAPKAHDRPTLSEVETFLQHYC